MKKAVFLDKDDTIVKNIPYSADPGKVYFLPGVIEGLKILRENGYELVIVTNQGGIAMGYFSEEDLYKLKIRIYNLLKKHNISLSGFYFCPHHPQGSITRYRIRCSCRKPNSGLIKQAARSLKIDLKNSWMIGDRDIDVIAGKKAGTRTVILSHENINRTNKKRLPVDYIASNFLQAVGFITI